jgi:short-subunit dehydrogenase
MSRPWRRRKPTADFIGRSALVTGASGGLGEAVARDLAHRGATVTITGRRQAELATIAEQIHGDYIVCDVADRAQLPELMARAAEVDILVSNAGLPASGRLEVLTVEQIDRALDVNLRAPLLLCRAAAPAMASRGHGSIVIMSSISAKLTGPAQAVYGATKAGLRSAALALREDMHGSGVTVSVVLPGPISDTGMWADSGLGSVPKMEKSPQDVADAVVDAMIRNRAEVDVSVPKLRAMSTLASVRPTWTARMGRKGAREFADAMTSAHSTKW